MIVCISSNMVAEEPDNQDEPCWVQCPDCDEYWCYIHDMHAHDCTCRDLEWWAEYGMFPYATTVQEYNQVLVDNPEAASTAECSEEW